jgi:hypothetical protein
MPLLTLTTCLHYLALVPLIRLNHANRVSRFTRIYANTILVTTFMSILMHSYPNSNLLCFMDYLFTGLWFTLDYLWSKALNKKIIVELNCLVFLAYTLSTLVPNYGLAHSVWHIISASKCFYVSLLIYKYDR